jgi:hypothetical protein
MRHQLVAAAIIGGLTLLGACGSSSKSVTGTAKNTSSFCAALQATATKYAGIANNPGIANQLATDAHKLANEAPTELEADINTLADALDQIAAGNTAALASQQAKIQSAADHMESYLTNTCHVSVPTT